jgi:hypothetical protein
MVQSPPRQSSGLGVAIQGTVLQVQFEHSGPPKHWTAIFKLIRSLPHEQYQGR